jgi:hypothetical protein
MYYVPIRIYYNPNVDWRIPIIPTGGTDMDRVTQKQYRRLSNLIVSGLVWGADGQKVLDDILDTLNLQPPEKSVLPVDPSKWAITYSGGYHIHAPGKADIDFIMAMPGVVEAVVEHLKGTHGDLHPTIRGALKKAGVTV